MSTANYYRNTERVPLRCEFCCNDTWLIKNVNYDIIRMNNFLYLIGRGHSIDVECCRKQMIEKWRSVNMKIEFSFDTLLALISCITGIVALFFGGSAYKSVHNLKKSFNDKKKFGDNGVDNFKKAGGDIVEYNCDTNALAMLTAANFKTSLEQAYALFEKRPTIIYTKLLKKPIR